jgi:hypothetical protein
MVTNMTQYPGGPRMPESNQSPKNPLNPTALSVADASLVLTKSGGIPVTETMIQEDIAKGAPTNADGTLNLVHFAAWLVKEMADAN